MLPSSSPSPRIEILRAAVDELRRLYDRLSNIYDGLKVKVLALIAGEVAIISFIFSGQSVKIPEEPYGVIFFATGLAAMAVAFGLLLWVISTADWLVPHDTKESRLLHKRYKTEEEFLEYLKDDYESCIDHCAGKIKKRSAVFNKTVLVLSSGVTILLVLKFSTGG